MNKVTCLIFFVAVLASGYAAPGPNPEEDGKIELFSGVAIEKDPSSGEDKLNVKFAPGELKDAARTFEEARSKVKKYSPLLAGLGVKVVAVLAILFGGLTLLVTKALVVAKLAFIAATALGIQKLLSSGSLNGISGKVESPSWTKIATGFQSSPQQWSSPTAAAATYPYARSSNLAQDADELAYKGQIPS